MTGTRKALIATAVILAVVLLAWYLVTLKSEERNDGYLVGEALNQIRTASFRHPQYEKNGYWVGDVAGLHDLSGLPREIAEADAAPIVPLVPKPKPYHGYLFIALESLPSGDLNVDVARERTKGQTFDGESFAFCAYPAASGPNKSVLLVSFGTFRKVMDGGIPVKKWPSKILESGWGIID